MRSLFVVSSGASIYCCCGYGWSVWTRSRSNDWLRQDEREAWSRRICQLRQELAQGQAQLSPPEPISSEQLRRERKSVRAIASSRYEQQ